MTPSRPPTTELPSTIVDSSGADTHQGGLEYVGHDAVNFSNGAYQWLDAKRFILPPGSESPLDLLLRHVRYSDHYTSPDSHENPTAGIHGPYRLDAISCEIFEYLDEAAAIATLNDFVTRYSTPSQDVLAELERVAYSSIRDASVHARLRDLGKEALHDWGGVLQDFTELVTWDIRTRRLTLLVAAID